MLRLRAEFNSDFFHRAKGVRHERQIRTVIKASAVKLRLMRKSVPRAACDVTRNAVVLYIGIEHALSPERIDLIGVSIIIEN